MFCSQLEYIKTIIIIIIIRLLESGFRLKILQQMAVWGGNRVKTYKTTDGTKVKEKKKEASLLPVS